jgi:hypothetical protein
LVNPQTRDWKLWVATFDVTETVAEPLVPLVVSSAEAARPTNTSTGRCAAGATVPAPRRISASSHCPTASFETSAVIVSSWVAPGARVKVDGDTVSPVFFGFVTETLQRALAPSELVTVLVHVHVASQPELATLGLFSLVGSPSSAGSAAV